MFVLNRCCRFLLLAGIAPLLWANSLQAAQEQGVKLTQLQDRVRIEINGALFTEYFFQDVARPYCYPLIGPDSLPMTRNWPMRNVDGEEQDHKHHRSFWFAHGKVNGMDFWSEEKGFCRTVHDKILAVESGKTSGLLKTRNNWVTADGTVICTDERVLRVYARPQNERLFDFEITLHAPAGKPVVFGDTKEGTMAVRVTESMRLTHAKKAPGQGHIVLSTGQRDQATWGKRAPWCDYYGPVQGKIVGIAMFDHPANPRYPTWWHVRDYGLFAANPFGIHDFEKKTADTGDLTIAPGKSLTFRYRFYLHQGDEQQAHVADYYQTYVSDIK